MALPFPRRTIDKDWEYAERLVLEQNLHTQLDSTISYLRTENYALRFPKSSNQLMTKPRNSPLPHIKTSRNIPNQFSMQDLDGAVYCRMLRMKLKQQEHQLMELVR